MKYKHKYLNKSFKEYNNSQIKNQNDITFFKRFHPYNPDQISFNYFDPEKSFPSGTFERFIVDIMKKIDITRFSEIKGLDKGGPDKINPRSLLGIIFYGYADGIFSSYKLADRCCFDNRYIFVSSGETPDRSTISRFISNNEEATKNIFTQILYIAHDMGFVDYKTIVTDVSKFKVYASHKFTATIDSFTKMKSRLEKNICVAIEKQKSTDKDEEIAYWQKKEERYSKDLKKIGNFLETAQVKTAFSKNYRETKQNINDNDCKVMKNKNDYTESYNAQASACEKNGLLIGHNVTNEVNDYRQLKPMVEIIENNAPQELKDKLKHSCYLFDNGYNSFENLMFCKEQGIDIYIPNKSDKAVYKDFTKKDLSKKNKINSNDCFIELKNNNFVFLCPKKIKLKYHSNRKSMGYDIKCYKISDSKKCQNCEYKEKCLPSRRDGYFMFNEKVLLNYEYFKELNDKIKSDKGRMIYSRRMPTIEKVFGHIKKNLRFDRFSVVGLNKVRLYWSLICSGYNLKRMFKLYY